MTMHSKINWPTDVQYCWVYMHTAVTATWTLKQEAYQHNTKKKQGEGYIMDYKSVVSKYSSVCQVSSVKTSFRQEYGENIGKRIMH